MHLLIAYSVNVLLVVTAFSELAQFFQCFLQTIVVKIICALHEKFVLELIIPLAKPSDLIKWCLLFKIY